jgi:L-lactate dehydrogenase complex protein LldF
VLIDNGRSRLYDSESAEILGCIRCGACMNVCPVYTSIGGHAYGDTYPGPVGAVVTPGLRGLHDWSDLPSASSLCGACRDVCPVRLDIPRMLLALRQQAASAHAPSWLRQTMWVFKTMVKHPRLYRAGSRLMRTMLRRRARDGWITQAPGPAAAWTAARDLPSPAARTFLQQWKDEKRHGAA